MDHNAQGRRPQHFHRGRRGSDRRGSDRRVPQAAAEQGARSSGDQLDVEQIMRDIRARIAQRHGIELTTQQVQELAARRLEAILDPRTINPALVEQLRRGAAAPADVPIQAVEGGYTFEDYTLYETHRGVLRFIRRLLNPILKLFFNPNPLVRALNTQARINKDAAARETERERRQAEWNALHYEILNRLVTEVSRVAIDMQALSARVESLAGRVDFNDRRVRTIESAATQPRPQQARAAETAAAAPAAAAPETVAAGPVTVEAPASEGGARRKRRRRRGRRSGGGMPEGVAASGAAAAAAGLVDEGADVEEPDDDEAVMAAEPEGLIEVEPAAPSPVEPSSPPAAEAAAPAAVEPSEPPPVQPTPPPDEPRPAAPVDHPDPGPPDR